MGPVGLAVLIELGFGVLDRVLDGLAEADLSPEEREKLLATYQTRIDASAAKARAWRPLTPADQDPVTPDGGL